VAADENTTDDGFKRIEKSRSNNVLCAEVYPEKLQD